MVPHVFECLSQIFVSLPLLCFGPAVVGSASGWGSLRPDPVYGFGCHMYQTQYFLSPSPMVRLCRTCSEVWVRCPNPISPASYFSHLRHSLALYLDMSWLGIPINSVTLDYRPGGFPGGQILHIGWRGIPFMGSGQTGMPECNDMMILGDSHLYWTLDFSTIWATNGSFLIFRPKPCAVCGWWWWGVWGDIVGWFSPISVFSAVLPLVFKT